MDENSKFNVIQTAIEEIESKAWGVTQQFLDIHQIVYVDNKPKVERADWEKDDGRIIVYFPVEGEKFYFAVCLSTDPTIAITAIYIEPYCALCFSASSEMLELDELSNMTTLKATSTWRKGDFKKVGVTVQHQVNRLRIEPNPGPDEFEDKMIKLLELLETDKQGIQKLVEHAGGYIQVAIEFHNGNSMVGGQNISREIIARMAALNLEIDFDLYISGKSYK